jgi:hypothetical protein
MSRDTICREFGEGGAANRRDVPRPLNPHRPSDIAWDAWNAGWDDEEGSAFCMAGKRA